MGYLKEFDWNILTLGIGTDIIMRLFIAFIFGSILGFERSLKRKNASVKTAIVITVTSALITIISIEASQLYATAYATPMDPLRLAAQAISGIGFLGAGLIMAKNANSITGLTTAAIMWSSVGFGIAIGAGFYKEAIFALIFIMIGIEIMPFVAKFLARDRLSKKRIEIRVIVQEEINLTDFFKSMKAAGLNLGHANIKDLKGGSHEVNIQALVNEKTYITDVYEKLKSIDGVLKIEVNGL